MAHLLQQRPVRVNPLRLRPGPRASGPPVWPGALDPAKAPKNVGAVVVAYMARHKTTTPAPTPTPVPLFRQRGLAPAGAKRASAIDVTSQNVTGINHWWSYEEGTIPGVGRWMVNAYSGNLIVQADDMDVPHRGIDLAFRRTYNSFSRHDFASNDSATEIGQYGSGWTNTFDAHLSTNGCPNTGYSWAGFYGFSVHDIDGARYDYCFNASGQLIPPPGMQATTLVANPDGGSFYWTKKSGTQYTFYAPYYGGTSTAYSGRIYRVSGRNQNNYIQFTYAWSPDASSSANLTNIYATTDNGALQATLTFANFNGQVLLSQLARPDGATTTYGYDGNGELISVAKPPPNNSGTPVLETYNGYQSFLMVAGPRWNAGGENDGGYIAFEMDETTTAQVDGIESAGVMNFAPGDGTNALLQPTIATGAILYEWESVSVQPTYTAFTDLDGHSVVQYIDASGRPTVRKQYSGSQWLSTTESWDTSNNIVFTLDPRLNETDYAYDPMGNTIAVAQPQTTTSAGTFRPTKLYDYDANNNVVAFCDEKATHAGGHEWNVNGPPTAGAPDALCANNGGSHAAFTFITTTAEPFGELTGMRTPLGYNHTLRYDAGPQGGVDFGLATSIAGDPIVQSDGTRTPLTTLVYDGNGNLVCSSADGNATNTTTVLTYDALSRVVATSDPDDASTSSPPCSRTSDIPGSLIVNRTTFYPNGQVSTTQSPAEAAANVSTQFQYDLDGNMTSEQRHYTTSSGPILKWYDGADRLIEVQQPTDPSDFYCFPWSTRYVYDLTLGGMVTVASSGTFSAYGGLYKTQEFLPSGVTTATWNETGSQNGPSTGTCNGSWQDRAGTAFDGLDRDVATYRNIGTGVIAVMSAYDTNGALGFLSTKCNASNECESFAYDARGAKSQTAFNVGTSTAQAFTYDEDGRLASASNGVGSVSDVYDADGRKSRRTENAGGMSTGLTYSYYGDGLRKSIDIWAAAESLTGIFAYTYRNDGLLRTIAVGTQNVSFSYTGGRRLTSRTDSTGQPADTFSYTGTGNPSSYGFMQSLSSPAYTESGMTYNGEGMQVGVTSAQYWNGFGWYGAAGMGGTYTSRGELTTTPTSPCCAALFANGTRVQTLRSSGTPRTGAFTFNVFQGMTVGASSGNSCAPCETGDNHADSSFAYDPVGRLTTTMVGDEPAPDAKSYDAEDHLVNHLVHSGRFMTSQQQLGYRWGAFGHPLQIGSTSVGSSTLPSDYQYDTLGWDDETLLYTVNPSGQIDDVKVGDFADYVPGATNALTVWNRDVNGQVISCQNAFGPAVASLYAPHQNVTISCNWNGNANVSFKPAGIGAASAVGRGGMLIVPKSDGFSDGVNIFQGVRTYDSQAGQWTAPDAYRGDIHDPISQKPYAWNRNNPLAYSDPSGYCADPGGMGVRVCTDMWIPFKSNGTPYPRLRGDDRQTWAQPPKGEADRYRVNVTINFKMHDVRITISDSHDMSGKDVGPTQDLGSGFVWNGDKSVTVTIATRCGGCPPFGPSIYAKITYTIGPDGKVHASGEATQYPSLEIYQYGSGAPHLLFEHDTGYYFGPLGLSVPDYHFPPTSR